MYSILLFTCFFFDCVEGCRSRESVLVGNLTAEKQSWQQYDPVFTPNDAQPIYFPLYTFVLCVRCWVGVAGSKTD